MADTEARGSGVDTTTEPKDDRAPEKLFLKNAKPESQNIMQIAKEFGAGTRHLWQIGILKILSQQLSVVTEQLEELKMARLRDAAKLTKEQAEAQAQQAEMQRMLSQQLSVVTKQLEELKKARLPEVQAKPGSQGLSSDQKLFGGQIGTLNKALK